MNQRNIHKNRDKIWSLALLVFLFAQVFVFARPAQAATTGPIVFRLTSNQNLDAIVSKFQISNSKSVFTNPILGFVYKGTMDLSKLPALKNSVGVVYAQNDGVVKANTIVTDQITTTNDPYFTTNDTQ